MKEKRSQYEPSKNLLQIVKDEETGRIAHEIAHWVEVQNPEVLKKCSDFLDRRCGDEKPTPLGNGYRADEYARRDKFFDPYCGKEYGKNGKRSATEVLTMGVERLLDDPAEFAEQDRDYFNFVVTTLGGMK